MHSFTYLSFLYSSLLQFILTFFIHSFTYTLINRSFILVFINSFIFNHSILFYLFIHSHLFIWSFFIHPFIVIITCLICWYVYLFICIQSPRFKNFDSSRNFLNPTLRAHLWPNSDDSLCHVIDSGKIFGST